MDTTQGYAMSLVDKIDVNYKPEVTEAFEIAAKLGLHCHFLELKSEGPVSNRLFTFRLTVGDFSGEGEGHTKAIAKTMAAQQVLVSLRKLPLPESNPKTKKGPKKNVNGPGLWQAAPVFKAGENPVSCLNNMVCQMRGAPPKYTIVDVDKTGTCWIFHIELIVANESVRAKGYSKKEAKANAAAMMLNVLGYDFPYVEPNHYVPDATPDVTQVDASPTAQGDATEKSSQDTTEVSQLDKPQEEVQSPSVDLQLLPEGALPLLASMGLIEDNNGIIQLSKHKPTDLYIPEVTQNAVSQKEVPPEGPVLPEEPKDSPVTLEVAVEVHQETASETLGDALQDTQEEPSEVTLEIAPEATEDGSSPVTEYDTVTVDEKIPSTSEDLQLLSLKDELQNMEVVLSSIELELNETSFTLDVVPGVNQETEPEILCDSLESAQEETPVEMSPEVTQVDSTKTTTDETSSISEEYAPSATQEECSEILLDGSFEEEVQASADPQILSPDLLPLLKSMRIIEDNNGKIQWYDSRSTTSLQEEVSENQRETSSAETTRRKKTTVTIVIEMVGVECSTTPAGSNLTIEAESPRQPDISAESEGSSSPELHFGPSATCSLTHAVVRKIQKMNGVRHRDECNALANSLDEKIKDLLDVGVNTDISNNKLRKIGETAAIHLAKEYGSFPKLLEAARRPEDADFEEAIVRHLNIQLKAFQNRPKSAVARFFSGLCLSPLHKPLTTTTGTISLYFEGNHCSPEDT